MGLGQAPQAIQIPTLTPTLAQRGGSAIYDPVNPITMSPKSIMEETASERVQRVFPDAAANTGKLTFDQEFPEFKKAAETGRPKSYVTEGVAKVLQGSRAAVRDVVSEVGQDVFAIFNVLFDRDTRSLVEGASNQEGLNRVAAEIGIARVVAEMIQRRPDAENQIKSLAKTIIDDAKTEGTELDAQKIAEAVAYAMTTGEREQAIGYDMARRDAERVDVDAGRSREWEAYLEDPGYALAAFDEAIDEPGQLASTAAQAASTAFDTDKQGVTAEDRSAALIRYKKEFMDQLPKYQGMSEGEKGWAIAEAGFRIAAGKSPNAITNIAEGLKGMGAEFAKDEKTKRAWDRSVDLSAAKYALSAVAKDEAQRDADRRKGFFFYDQDKKSKTRPHGELVHVSLANLVANNGRIPSNLVHKDVVLADIASVKDTGAVLNKQLLENAKLYRIGSVEADKMRKNLSKYENAFISGEVGISLLNSVLANVAAGDITGFGSAGQELIGKAYKSAGKNPNKKYTKIEDAKADIGRVLQLLIPISLGKSQTANSISNRDVELLANAYIDSAFLDKNGVLGFITTGKDPLGRKLMGAMKVFRDKQLEALAGFDDVINRLNTSNQRILSAQTLGIPVDPGPFGRDYFAQTLSRVSPLAERTRGLAQDSDQAAVQPRLWSYDFDPETNKFRYKGAEGTTFAGQFFEPTKENLGKLSIVPKD